MCKCLSKTMVSKLMEKNNISNDAVTAYIVGSNKTCKWTFDKEMDDEKPAFDKATEQKLVNFFTDKGIEIPDTCYIDWERRGRNNELRQSSPKGRVINNISPKVKERIYAMGWKCSMIYPYFSNTSASQFDNLMNRHFKTCAEEDYNLVAYLCRCDVNKLPAGGGQLGLYHDSTFRPGRVKCNYKLNAEFFNKHFNDTEVEEFCKTVGIPMHFYHEMIKGELRLPIKSKDIVVKYLVDHSLSGISAEELETLAIINITAEKSKIQESEIKTENKSVKLSEITSEDFFGRKLNDEIKKIIEEAPTIKMSELEEICEESNSDNLRITEVKDQILTNYINWSAEDLKNLSTLCSSLATVVEINKLF